MVAKEEELECGPMPNMMVALPNVGGALCSTPQSLADAHCWSKLGEHVCPTVKTLKDIFMMIFIHWSDKTSSK